MQNFFKCCASIAVSRDMTTSGAPFPRDAEGDGDEAGFVVGGNSAAEGLAEVSDRREMKWQERPGLRQGQQGDGPLTTGQQQQRKAEPASATPRTQASSSHAQSSVSRQDKLSMSQLEEVGADDDGKEECAIESASRGRASYQAPIEDKAPTGRALSPESAFKEPVEECPATPSGGLRLEYMADCKDNSQSKRRPPQARKEEPKFEQAASSSSSTSKKQPTGLQAKDIGQQPKDVDPQQKEVSLQPKDVDM